MSRVCVLLAPGFEEIEAVTIIDVLRRAEIEVVTLSVAGKGLEVEKRLLFQGNQYGVDVAISVREDGQEVAKEVLFGPGIGTGTKKKMTDVVGSITIAAITMPKTLPLAPRQRYDGSSRRSAKTTRSEPRPATA